MSNWSNNQKELFMARIINSIIPVFHFNYNTPLNRTVACIIKVMQSISVGAQLITSTYCLCTGVYCTVDPLPNNKWAEVCAVSDICY